MNLELPEALAAVVKLRFRFGASWLSAVTVITFASGCASYDPLPIEEVPFQDHSETKTQSGLTVSAAVLTAEESQQVFGRPLVSNGIQPVWLSVENRGHARAELLLRDVDPDYFSPSETAYICRVGCEDDNRRMADQYRRSAVPRGVNPGKKISGFVFTNHVVGTKLVPVTLFMDGDVERFSFYLRVSGLEVDHETVDFESLYDENEFVDIADEDEFRRVLEQFQCCTNDRAGERDGDPLNFVLVGDGETVFATFIRAGWHETEIVTTSTAFKTFWSFVVSTEYRYSPISPLYVFGRHQDIAFQKSRGTINERNHLRIWLAPWRYQGQSVFIGQISRDVGVRFTLKTWNLTTHAIDPDVDETREYLTEDFLITQAISRIGYCKGVGPATPDAPREILLGDPYWTDGLRAVLIFSEKIVPLNEIGFLDWETPGSASSDLEFSLPDP